MSHAAQRIRIATRQSPLAMWQAEHVRQRLLQHHPALDVQLIGMTTEGDRKLDTPLAAVGGKGLFLKELEQALLEDRADIAVHSMKDVTVQLPPRLEIAVMCKRADPRDAFVSSAYPNLESLPAGAVLGTSSLRRQSQLKYHYPHLTVRTLRGNVNTRLKKLDAGEFDAIILAAAGLSRLGLDSRIRALLTMDKSLPAVGQGVMGIECRAADRTTAATVAPLNDADAELCVRAERAMNAALEGGCQVPIAGYARLHGEHLALRGLVGCPDGTRVLTAEWTGNRTEPERAGHEVARQLLEQGAREILDAVYHSR